MNWNIELTINTDYQRFENWLNQYRLKTTPFIINLEGDKTLHVIGAPTLERENQGFRYHRIKASIGKPSDTDPKALAMSWDFPVIEIELFEVASSRLSVKIECKHDALYIFYLELLQAITNLYPETGQTVLDYLSQLHPDTEVKSEQSMTIDQDTARVPLAGLVNDSIRQIAINSTGVTPDAAYDNLPLKELKHKAARFDAIRYGDVDKKYELFRQEANAAIIQGALNGIQYDKVGNQANVQSGAKALPEIEDPTDLRIWELIKMDTSITDTAIAQKLGNMTRQAVNTRRRALEKMGYPVRKVSRQKK